jgi:tryptophan synthase alpha chain
VAVAGVTGERSRVAEGLADRLRELRAQTQLPLCVGFGVSTPDQAAALREVADGVIVGSAVVRQVEALAGDAVADAAPLEALAKWSRSFVEALKMGPGQPQARV